MKVTFAANIKAGKLEARIMRCADIYHIERLADEKHINGYYAPSFAEAVAKVEKWMTETIID